MFEIWFFFYFKHFVYGILSFYDIDIVYDLDVDVKDYRSSGNVILPYPEVGYQFFVQKLPNETNARKAYIHYYGELKYGPSKMNIQFYPKDDAQMQIIAHRVKFQ